MPLAGVFIALLAIKNIAIKKGEELTLFTLLNMNLRDYFNPYGFIYPLATGRLYPNRL